MSNAYSDLCRSSAGFRRGRNHPRFYRFTYLLQSLLERIGIHWHNSFADECCSDFSCCDKRGKK